MVSKRSSAHRCPDGPRVLPPNLVQVPDDISSTRCHQNFLPWLEELVDASPGICDDASTSSRGFKHPGWRRKSDLRHRLAVNIHYHAHGAVDLVMVVGANVPNATHISQPTLASPAPATKQKLKPPGLSTRSQQDMV